MSSRSPDQKRRKLEEEKEDGQMCKEFLQWGELPPEVRSHCLSFCDRPTLFQYAQASRLCNAEIQKFDRYSPTSVFLMDVEDGVRIVLKYLKGSRDHYFDRSIINPSPWQFLAKFCRYLRYGEIQKISINMQNFPSEIMSIPRIRSIKNWKITVKQLDFLAYICENTNINELVLHEDSSKMDKLEIPATFFKSPCFQQLNKAVFVIKCDVDEQDFINWDIEHVKLQCSSISDQAVNEKMRRWYDGHGIDKMYFMITDHDPYRRISELAIMAGFDWHEHGEKRIERNDGAIGIAKNDYKFVRFDSM